MTMSFSQSLKAENENKRVKKEDRSFGISVTMGASAV